MNRQQGLVIRAFKRAHLNRHKDKELKHLARYLALIAGLDKLDDLHHNRCVGMCVWLYVIACVCTCVRPPVVVGCVHGTMLLWAPTAATFEAVRRSTQGAHTCALCCTFLLLFCAALFVGSVPPLGACPFCSLRRWEEYLTGERLLPSGR